MAVQKSSRTRQRMEMKRPISLVIPIWAVDMANPPSRPPSWRGRKKRRLAKRLVKARMRNEWRKERGVADSRVVKSDVSEGVQMKMMKTISNDCNIRPMNSRAKLP